MGNDDARNRGVYQALKAVDEVGAALQAHLVEEHGADPDGTAPGNSGAHSIKLLRQARERLSEGLRAVDALTESDRIPLRQRQDGPPR